MSKNNNRRVYSKVEVQREDFPPYLVPVDTGEEVIMMPESDRYRGIPASAYDLQNQIAEGIALEQCPTYMQLSGLHGADVATRLANRFRDLVTQEQLRAERERVFGNVPVNNSSAPPPAAAD